MHCSGPMNSARGTELEKKKKKKKKRKNANAVDVRCIQTEL